MNHDTKSTCIEGAKVNAGSEVLNWLGKHTIRNFVVNYKFVTSCDCFYEKFTERYRNCVLYKQSLTFSVLYQCQCL